MSFQPGATAGGASIDSLTVTYVEFTANVTVSGTSGSPTTVVTAGAFAANGSDSYWIEFYCPEILTGSADFVIISLFEDGSNIGVMAQLGSVTGGFPMIVTRKHKPGAGVRTYSIRAHRVTNDGTIVANVGGSGQYFPGYISITKAT